MQTLLLATVALTSTALAAWGGPLDPPPGPIAPTHKTLTEVEPRIPISAASTPGDANSLFKITQSGSYYLTGNITGVPGFQGIEIAVSGVTLDLRGFRLTGVPGSLGGIIDSSIGGAGVEIHSGYVSNWGGTGVAAGTGGSTSIVRDIRSRGNGENGIAVGIASTVVGCVASLNGFDGINTNNSCSVINCTAYDNTDDGIDAGVNVVIIACTANSNGASGIETSGNATIADCTAVANDASGIQCSTASSVSRCTAVSNDFDGIQGGASQHIANNLVRENGRDGIRVASSSVVLANNCLANGALEAGAGVHAIGTNNRIEGNNCTSATFGIDVDAVGNIIIRNTCADNDTNWAIAANNNYGPIINRAGVATAAVNGDSATEALGSTHPNANFTY